MPSMRLGLIFLALHAILSATDGHSTTPTSLNNNDATHTLYRYQHARYIRTTQGHNAAQPLLKDIIHNFSADRTAATRIASSPYSLTRQDQLVQPRQDQDNNHESSSRRQFLQLLQDSNYNPRHIATHVFGNDDSSSSQKKMALASCAPLYLTPLAAGAACPHLPTCRLSCWIQLLLQSVCIPLDIWLEHFTMKDLEVCETVGVAFLEDGYIIPYCHVMPVHTLNKEEESLESKTFWVATDLHPQVLNTIYVGTEEEGAVMYLGPDSLALLQHFSIKLPDDNDSASILDLGTGSGIQALVAQATTRAKHVTCVDVNRRALLMTRLNFQWNTNDNVHLNLVWGDLREDQGRRLILDNTNKKGMTNTSRLEPWHDLLSRPNQPTLILSNPPFLPVPEIDSVISKRRHGWFSGGGKSGSDLLQRVVELSAKLLSPSGTLAVVSEFMNPHIVGNRLEIWWDGSNESSSESESATGILFTNEVPVDASTYAERRADNTDETSIWKEHLDRQGISHISPGLLFVHKHENQRHGLQLQHQMVPKTAQGSIWTPTNQDAVAFTQTHLQQCFGN